MMNVMDINGYKAIIQYDPEIDMFRGEFIGLNGGADFYATIESLKKEAALSLKIFLEMCAEDGVEPRKNYSGRFNLRLPPELHAQVSNAAHAEGKSLNMWIVGTLEQAVDAY